MTNNRWRAPTIVGYPAKLPNAMSQLQARASPLAQLFSRRAVQKGPQLAAARGMAELAECLGFDLADAFPRDRKVLTDFFQGVVTPVIQTKPHLDDLLFPRRQGLQDIFGHLLQVDVDDRFGRRDHLAVFDKVAQMGILFFANGCL